MIIGMPARERAADRGARIARRAVRELGEELRRARIAAGLSQASVGRALGVSRTTVGRLEVGVANSVSLILLSRALAVVGMELSVRAYPKGSPLRDRPHAQLLDRLRVKLHPTLRWRTEVPFPNAGDLRAWDAVIGGVRWRVGVEAETRPRDGQELERRLATKRRDGGMDGLILLLSDTRSNRAFLLDRVSFRDAYPSPAREALAALAAGQMPPGDAIILL